MRHQMLRHRLHTPEHAVFKIRLSEGCFHLVADLVPLVRADLGVNPAIGHDFHRPIREQHINQQTIVELGIPHALLRKNVDRPLPGRLVREQRPTVQRPLHHEADFADMCGLTGFDRVLDLAQGLCRKGAFDLSPGCQPMRHDAFDIHGYHLPDAPPPPNPPPPPRNPPLPEPPPPPPKPPSPKPRPPSKVTKSAITPASKAMEMAPT